MECMRLLALLFVARGIGGLRLQSSCDECNDHTDSDSLSQLWEGMDDIPNSEFQVTHSEFRIPSNKSTMLPKLQILGMFDSGTNLLGALLKKNLGAEVFKKICPGSTNIFESGYHCHFWKHTPPQDIHRLDLHMIALVRSPIAQLSGWIKAPYDLKKCIHKVNWLDDQNTTCRVRKGHYNGPTGVWNGFTRGYQNLAAEGATIKIIEYENVVLNTEKVVRDIGMFLGVPIDTFHQIPGPAKKHGKAIGHELALQKVRNMTYMKNLPWSVAGNVKEACRNLDKSMMEHHRVQLTRSEERLYKCDCD